MKNETKSTKKPFFARYLEGQELEAVTGGTKSKPTMKYPSDTDEAPTQTLRYPSDSDEGSAL